MMKGSNRGSVIIVGRLGVVTTQTSRALYTLETVFHVDI